MLGALSRRMTPEEINEAVAKKLGHSRCRKPFGSCLASGTHDPMKWHWWPPKGFCTDIKAAWEIVEKHEFLVAKVEAGWLAGTWDGRFFDQHYVDTYGDFQEADTAPMAICKAFLKLK